MKAAGSAQDLGRLMGDIQTADLFLSNRAGLGQTSSERPDKQMSESEPQELEVDINWKSPSLLVLGAVASGNMS